jgi:glycine cleavage system transcriptional repressor
MNQYLVVTAVGDDRPGIVGQLSEVIVQHGGNITESRMSVLGGEFAMIVLVDGNADAIGRIQQELAQLESRLELKIVTKRTSPRALTRNLLPWYVSVVSMDHPGIVHNVADFFAERDINIEEVETRAYAAPHTGTKMFALTMTIGVPAETNIGKIKKDFAEFCDGINVDGEIETRH